MPDEFEETHVGADLALAEAVELMIAQSMPAHEYDESRDAIHQLVLNALED